MKAFRIAITIFYIYVSIKQCGCKSYKVTDQVFFDIESEGSYMGRIVIGLFGEVAPKTVANFKILATNGINNMTYEGSRFHRITERFLIHGGDVVHNNGSGSISIFGKKFKDESFQISHNSPGIVSMANIGKNTNGCQFFITTMSATWLDGRHVAFGKVVYGQDVVHKIEHIKTNSNDEPIFDVIIRRCGIIPTKPFFEANDPYELSLWAWFKAGWFPLSFSMCILIFFHWVMSQL